MDVFGQKKKKSGSEGRLLFFCIVCVWISGSNYTDNGFSYYQQYQHERIRPDDPVWVDAGCRNERQTGDPYGDGGGVYLRADGNCGRSPYRNPG